MSSQHLPDDSLSTVNPRTARRPRVLICACKSQEFFDVLRFLDRIETMHTPSRDLRELNTELHEFRPDFIFCGFDFAVDLILTRASTIADTGDGSDTALKTPSSDSQLNSRGQEVLQLLANGATNADIAKALNLGIATVKRTLQGLYEQFEVANRAEFLGRAMELQLLRAVSPDQSAKTSNNHQSLL